MHFGTSQRDVTYLFVSVTESAARVRPSSPGSLNLAVGTGEQGRGPQTTTHATGSPRWTGQRRSRQLHPIGSSSRIRRIL